MPYKDPEAKREYQRRYHEQHRVRLAENRRAWHKKRYDSDHHDPKGHGA